MTLNNRLLGIFALFLAVFLVWFGYDLEAPFSYEPVGPKAFPLLLGGVIALCGVILLVKGGGEVEANPPGANLRIVLMAAVLLVYALLFQWLGFVIATILAVTAIGRLFGGSWLKVLISSVVMSVLFFFLFDRVLDVVLPPGLLGGLL